MDKNETKEAQEQELEAIEAIFADDFKLIPTTWGGQPPQFMIRLTPPPGMADEIYASVWLTIRFTRSYPRNAPIIELEKIEGLSDEQLAELQSLLEKEAKGMLGREMVYDLTEIVREFLLRHNHKTLSFYDEMMLHKKEEEREALEKEHKRMVEETNERKKKEDPLERRIREEFKRKEEALRRIKKKDSDWLVPMDDDMSDDDDYGDYSEASDNSFVPAKGKEKGASVAIKANALAKGLHDRKEEVVKKGDNQPIRWKRRNSLGRGTFGEVILGMNLGTRKLMAVKEVNFGNVPDINKKMDLVANEIESLRALRHPHIVDYLGTEKEDNTLRIFLEFVAGASSLAQHLKESGGLNETMLRKYTRQILEGLKYLHDRGAVHGDIKCLNMLLDHKGNLKLSDYGCTNAKINALLTAKASDFTKNTPKKEEDIFSLGVAVIQMAKGMPDDVNPAIPDYLSRNAKDFIQSCLRRSMKDRPTAHKLLLHPFVADISTPNPWYLPGSPPSSVTPMPHRRPIDESSTQSSMSSGHESLAHSQNNINSRYHADFIELEELGRGGFGSVVKVKNRLDGRLYAIKKIKLHPGDSFNQKMLREVTTLSRLNHQYVVRYFQAWTEGGADSTLPYEEDEDDVEEEDWLSSSSMTSLTRDLGLKLDAAEAKKKKNAGGGQKGRAALEKSSDSEDYFIRDGQDDTDDDAQDDDGFDDDGGDEDDQDNHDDSDEENDDDDEDYDSSDAATTQAKGQRGRNGAPETLYIQMEYCPGDTLRTAIDKGLSDDEIWRLFRQILEGLNHIHLQGIIHRDLKPMNIFLDQNGDVKIGDFGLATTGTGRVAKKELREFASLNSSVDSVSSLKESLTIGVGTPFYCSPEQLKAGMHYDQKVDLYSLGIILFEMCHPITTGMERAEVLTALRNDMKLPNGFEKEHPTEAELIRWLLQEDPNARPTTMELLKSDLLPAKLEEEILKEALRTITIPGTTIFNMLIEKLFSLVPDEHLDYTYDSHATSKLHSTAELLLREQAFHRITEVFKRHGAMLLETPLLVPKSGVLEEGNVATLMDDSGSVLMLPYDLTLPFARYAAHKDIVSLKRYNVARVYRKNPAGGQPRELFECDFDIIGPVSSRSVHDAETIKVLVEVLEDFSKQLGPYSIKINHHKILLAMMDICGFPKETRAKVCHVIEQLWKRKQRHRGSFTAAQGKTGQTAGAGPLPSTSPSSSGSGIANTGPGGKPDNKLWTNINKYLLKIPGVSQKSVDMLSQFLNVRGDIQTMLLKLEKLIKGHRQGQEGLEELRQAVKYLQIFGVLDRVFLDIGLAYNFLYYDGLIFQAVLQEQNEVIAAGGRYDGLVAKFQPPNSTSSAVAAVGVNIAIAKLISSFIAYETRKAKNEGRKLRNCETEAYVCYIGRNMVEECIEICMELWAKNIKAEYMDGASNTAIGGTGLMGAAAGANAITVGGGKHTMEELFLACKQAGVRWMVVLKDRNYEKTKMAKVRDVQTRTDADVHKKDLAEYLSLLKSGAALAQLQAAVKTPSREISREAMTEMVGPTASGSNVNTRGSTGGGKGTKDSGGGSSGGVYEVTILNTNLPSRRKKQISLDVNKALGPRMTSVVSPNKTKVWAVELPVQVLRELVACAGGIGFHQPIQKYPRFKDAIIELRDALTAHDAASMPLVFLFSIPDGKYELFLFRS